MSPGVMGLCWLPVLASQARLFAAGLFLYFCPSVLESGGAVEDRMPWSGVWVEGEVAFALELETVTGRTVCKKGLGLAAGKYSE